MAKDSYWFKHDSEARNDIKLVKLRKIYTHWSDGIYWNIVEVLRGQKDYKYPLNESDLQLLCEELIRCHDFDKFRNWLNDSFNLTPESLFAKDELFFWSESLINRMKKWEILKKNGEKGGRPVDNKGIQEEPDPKPDGKPEQEPDPKPDGKPLEYIRRDNIIYNKFYDTEIKNNQNHDLIEKYKSFLNFIFGKIGTDGEMEYVLKLSKQLTFKQFLVLRTRSRKENIPLDSIVKKMNNWAPLLKRHKTFKGSADTFIDTEIKGKK